MKIVIDINIPFLRDVLEKYADVVYLPGEAILHDKIKDADALLIRSRTKAGKELLSGSSIKFIGTATIGTDHIDTAWCDANGIKWVNAPGCNSGSVMQYITSSLTWLSWKYDFDLKSKTLGIVGAGNVGSKVHNMALALGMKVLLNDPPRERAEGKGDFVSFDDVAGSSDIVSFHVPLTFSGTDKTAGMASEAFFRTAKKGQIIINSSRGGIINESLLLDSLQRKYTLSVVTDVWLGEPALNIDLMNRCDIATPHIAGYSIDGKRNASRMIIEQLSDFFSMNLPDDILAQPGEVPGNPIYIDKNDPVEMQIRKAVFSTYNVETDSLALKANPRSFEELRNNYPVRREFHTYNIEGNGDSLTVLRKLGFK